MDERETELHDASTPADLEQASWLAELDEAGEPRGTGEPEPRLPLITLGEAREIVQLLLAMDTRESRHMASELGRRLPDG